MKPNESNIAREKVALDRIYLFKFVKATESDKDYLLTLRKLTMTEHLESVGLFLTEEEHVDRLNHKFDCSYLVFFNKDKVGHVKYELNEQNLDLIQIQIDPKFQGKGIGSVAIKRMLREGKGKRITLSVLKANPAVRLYEKFGFEIVDEDKYEYHMRAIG